MLKDVTKCYLHFFKYPTSRVCSPGDYVGFYVRAERVVSLYMSPYGGQGIMLHQTFFQLWIASRVGEDIWRDSILLYCSVLIIYWVQKPDKAGHLM